MRQDPVLLKEVISDLLTVHGITPVFETRPEFNADDLFDIDRSRSTHQIVVWVFMPRPDNVRLVFSDPGLQRFLLREIPLPLGLDVLGRETVAQVIESSTLALLQGSAGVSRAELRNSFNPSSAQQTGAPLPAAPAHFDRSKDSPRAIRHRLGANYGFSLSGSDFGVLQGPGITAGLESAAPSGSLLLSAAFEWHFQRHHRTADFDLAVQSELLWLLAGFRTPIRDATCFLATVGPGVEFSRASATASGVGPIPVEPNAARLNLWSRLQLGLEWGDSPLVFQLARVTDLSPYRIHFEVVRAGANETLANPWAVRPGLMLGALWR